MFHLEAAAEGDIYHFLPILTGDVFTDILGIFIYWHPPLFSSWKPPLPFFSLVENPRI